MELAGSEIIKSRIKKTIEWAYNSGSVKIQKYGNGFFYSMDAANSTTWKRTNEQLIADFVEVPEVNAVLNYKARAFSAMKIRALKKATGEEYTGSDKLAYMFSNPNWFQSGKEFLRQTKLFHDIFGNEFNYYQVPFGFNLDNTNAVFSLPPYMVEVRIDEKAPQFYNIADAKQFVSYWFVWSENGQKKEVKLDGELINHMNENRIDFNSGNMLMGVSSLQSVSVNVANIRAAYEARNVLISNRGALGILSNDTEDSAGRLLMDDKEKAQIQSDLRNYGLGKHKDQWAISNYNLKWTGITQNIDELKLFEEVKDDLIKICNVMNVPTELFLAETTFDNKKQADKQFYQNTIIPEAEEWIDSQNAMFNNYSKEWYWVADFSHIPALQEDRRLNASTFTTAMTGLEKAINMQIMTVDEAKEALNKFIP